MRKRIAIALLAAAATLSPFPDRSGSARVHLVLQALQRRNLLSHRPAASLSPSDNRNRYQECSRAASFQQSSS